MLRPLNTTDCFDKSGEAFSGVDSLRHMAGVTCTTENFDLYLGPAPLPDGQTRIVRLGGDDHGGLDHADSL